MKIIGIGGTNGSGKDTVGELLAENHGWLFISVTEILRDELRHREDSITRKNLRLLSAEWRRQFGLGVLIDKALQEYEKKKAGHDIGGLAIASLRNFGEAERVHELGGKVVWVDADPKIRYQRVIGRVRSDEDRITFEEFLHDEQEEMHLYKDDEATLNLQGVKDRADIFLTNNTNHLEDFKKTVRESLADYL
jgi:dephospho-CoA kinase